MINSTTQHPISNKSARVRNICAYATLYSGIILGAFALVLLFGPATADTPLVGFTWFVASFLVIWLAWGMVEGNEKSWKLHHGAGTVATGGVGIVLLLYGVQDATRWTPDISGPAINQIIVWLLGGLVIVIWAFGQLCNHRIALFLWHISAVLLGIGMTFLLASKAYALMQNQQPLAVLISAGWIGLCVLLLRVILRPDHHSIMASLLDGSEKLDIPTRFPTKFHENLARGRLCDLFEMPCKNPCPLTTKVAMQYQQLKLKHKDSPEMLDAIEKAYVILITPRLRELCSIAHEIMDAKKKQLGKHRYESLEILLWTKLWKRLQDNDIKGDPQRAKAEKQRLMKEF